MTPTALSDDPIRTYASKSWVFTQLRIDENPNDTKMSASTLSIFAEGEVRHFSEAAFSWTEEAEHSSLATNKFEVSDCVKIRLIGRDYIEGPSPRERLASEHHQKSVATEKAKTVYRERISELRLDATLDGIFLNKTSEREFWTFLGSLGFFRKGSLFLLDNGNLRAVWKNDTGDQVGLQFLGNKTIQYVMFTHRPHATHVSRSYGRDTLDDIRRQIAALNLSHLLSV